MPLTQCPHCLVSVEPTSTRRCPACSKSFDDVTEVRRSQARHEIHDTVLDALAAGRRRDDIARELGGRHDPTLVEEVLDEVTAEHRARRFEIARTYLWPGYGLLATGSLSVATRFAGAPFGIVSRGMIAYGLVSVLLGHWLRRRYR